MDKFTSGERRGAIAVIGVIAAVVVYLAVSRSLHSSVPAPLGDTVVSVVMADDAKASKSVDSISGRRKHKPKSAARKSRSHQRPSLPDRNPLSEPVN